MTDPADYRTTQALGTALATAGVEAVEYVSARDPGRDLNIALFSPHALSCRRPLDRQRWLCETRDDSICFYSDEADTVIGFARETFLIDGRLPIPAL